MRTRKITPVDQPGWWADIPGYCGMYQASRMGEIRRMHPDGRVTIFTPYMKAGKKSKKICRNRRFVHLQTPGGKRKEMPVSKAVWMAFNGVPPKGACVFHINGDVTDNRLDNLTLKSRQEIGKATGGTTSRFDTVAMIDQDGNAVAFYRSARDAAKENHLSYQAVLDRCHNRVKNPFALTGYTFQFEQ